jgi:hypothetical protein
MLGERKKPCDKLDAVAQLKPGSCQRGHVQRLADMASRVRPVGVLVKETARRKKQHGGTSQQR